MRILEIVSGAGVNGAVMHCLLLTRELSSRGHRITLVCRPNSWIAGQFEETSVRVVTSSLKRWPPVELKRIAQCCREDAIEVAHSHMSSAHFFAVLLRLFWGTPCVATAQNRKLQLHWMFNDRVIAPCIPVARFQRLVNLVPRRRLRVIPNFIDVAAFPPQPGTRESMRASLGIAPDDFVLLTMGQVIARKGLLYLVRALPAILSQFPRARLVVAGSGGDYGKRIDDEVRRLGLADKVMFLGHRKDPRNVLAAADIFVQPSLEEAQSIALIEAMASGLPAVATDVGGTPECALDGVTAILVPARRSDALAEAVLALLRDEALRHRMGTAGRQRARKHFDMGPQCARIADVLAEAAALRSPA